jgi:hypothetical protein
MEDPALDALFARSEPKVRAIAQALILRVRDWPGVTVDPKRTSIHLNRRSAFAGLHPRKSALLLNIRSSAPIDSERVRRRERVSANRFHNEMLLDSADALDAELVGWLSDAYALAG